MPFTPLSFTGVSSYSDDLNTVLKRAVAIASLPLTAVQNADADILSKKTALTSLTSSVSTLASSLTALGEVAKNKGLAASTSDPSKVAIAYSGATSSATYSISDITSVASAASETSLSGYSDSTSAQVSASGSVKLVIGNQTKTIPLSPGANNLAGLRDAINALGVGVTATILTTGTGLTPDYLSLTADNFGATTLQLIEDPDGTPIDLLTSANQGSNAEFKLNGVPVSKSSNVISNVISGATFRILDTTDPSETVTLSLHSDRTQLQNAIQDFATNYNSLVDAVGKQIGSGAGLLSGDFLVREIQSDMRLLTSFVGSGSIQSLSDVGIELGQDGKMTFDTAAFAALSDGQIASAFDFFSPSSTGFAALASKLTDISDPITGLSKLQQDNYDQADRRLQSQIADLNNRITDLQTNVTARLQAADALLAQLDSQQKILTASIDALNMVSYGKKDN